MGLLDGLFSDMYGSLRRDNSGSVYSCCSNGLVVLQARDVLFRYKLFGAFEICIALPFASACTSAAFADT